MSHSFQSNIIIICICILSFPILISSYELSSYIPILYKVGQRHMECIHENFEKGDFATYSVFVVQVLNNGNPKAAITFEGPIAGNKDTLQKSDITYDSSEDSTLGRELRTGIQVHWPKVKDADQRVRFDKRVGVINRSIKVDWTHAGESEDAVTARAQIDAERREAYKSYGRGAPRSEVDAEMAKNEKFKTINQVKIEPYEETNAIKAPGWYRLCVSAEYHALVVEMEIRSGNKLGGVDRTTGHVYTYEDREMLDEEKLIDEGITSQEESQLDANTYASLDKEIQKQVENQVKEQDLHASKAQVKHLNTMVMEMKKKQTEHHHRMKSHEQLAGRNYKKIIRNGIVQTVLFLVITLFQLYTIHKWLLSNSLLGR